jgi:hypothetical protein
MRNHQICVLLHQTTIGKTKVFRILNRLEYEAFDSDFFVSETLNIPNIILQKYESLKN